MVAAGEQIRISEQPTASTTLAAVTVAGVGTLDTVNLPSRTAIVTAPPFTTVVMFRNQAFASGGGTHVACALESPPSTSTAPLILDLKEGSPWTTAPLPSWASFKTPLTAFPAGSAHEGWTWGSLKIDMTGYCKANFVVEYEGQPSGWTVDIGDSPTNNGYGGDAGTTVNSAELQLLNNTMTAYSRALSPGVVIPLGSRTFDLQYGAVKFSVSNGALSSGQPYSAIVDSRLFSFPDSIGSDSSFIYAAFNSVISPTAGRDGHGARRVMITLQ